MGADYSTKASPQCVNTCVATLRMVIDLAIDAGARYDNPAGSSKNCGSGKRTAIAEPRSILKMVESIER